MKRLSSPQELLSHAEQVHKKLAQRDSKVQVKVHLGTCGISGGARKVLDAFRRELPARNLPHVLLLEAACIGLCSREPTVTVIEPGNRKTIYVDVTEAAVTRIIEEHLKGGRQVKELSLDLESPMLKLQEIRIMHNQDINPMEIDEYIARGGYQALARVLAGVKPEAVLEEIKKAGIRGRGGAGFPVAMKWTFLRNAVGQEKFLVCNGDEGDPGAYMNRAVLEGNPHSIIEGMTIGAYTVGNVKQGYAYVRAEYPLAIETLSHAIAKAREYGVLGENILGTNFQFNLSIFPGAGAFVCGEETALLASIEGRRGNPRQRPPFPANKGLFGKPTAINNVETWSNIPQIILNGADWFAGVGNEKSKGTKTLCLVGKINQPGLVEVPLGTPLGKIIFDIGGGCPTGKKFKGVQLGGPSGGVIPTQHLNTPVDYDAVPALGAIMGSGGVVVMDEDSCMVDVAKYFLGFTKDESCGKCTACRAGIPEMLELLTRISKGQGKMEDIALLEELGDMVSSTSLCGLGQTSANPVLTTLRYFREEYEAHIIDKKCPAAVCQGLFKAPCQHTCPVGLDIPGYISLIKEGKFAEAYGLIKQRNPLPLVCGRVCNHPCEAKCRRAQIDEPMAIRQLKRSAADYASEMGIEYVPPVKTPRADRVAVVGSGPAGLSAAYDLAQAGYPTTIYEALPVAGGMLAVGIPEYRLPKDILTREIDSIRRLGVEIKLDSRVDDIDALFKQGFKAVFVASGAHKGDKMNIPGEDLEGVYDAIYLLKEVNLGRDVNVGKKVAVVGGGNSAIDAARVALRKGAAEVHIIYRREKEDMPAIGEEVEAAEAEGIKVDALTAPVKIVGRAGKVTGLQCVRMELKEFDKSGRRTPYPIAGSEFVMEADTVIEAIGQRPDTSFIKSDTIKTGRGGVISADPRTLATARPGVFAGGDAMTGPQTVIEAIAAGQRAASSIIRFLEGKELSPIIERNGHRPIAYSQEPPSEKETEKRDRTRVEELSVAERVSTFKEISLPYSMKQAMAEATRCLRCDIGVGE